MNASGPYFLGRPHVPLTEPYSEADKTFASERLDGQAIESPNYQHCTFANLSFKKAMLVHGTFENCVFVGCYFRRTELRNSKFVGCRFFDCNFNQVILKSCDFRYSTFHGCQIPFKEMAHCFPSEPNLAEELARNLSIESSRLGLSAEAKNFRRVQIKAHERHLKAVFLGSSTWYKEHFDFVERIKALSRWVGSMLNGWLWGYGDRAGVLIRNLLVLSVIVFPAVFFLNRRQLASAGGEQVTIVDTVIFSLKNILPAGIESEIVATGIVTKFFAGLESLFGVVVIALFAAYVFRWSLHR